MLTVCRQPVWSMWGICGEPIELHDGKWHHVTRTAIGHDAMYLNTGRQPVDRFKFNIEECRSCRKAIIWARTAAGKPMPVDAAPNPLVGNVELSTDGVVRARVLPAEEWAKRTDLHTSHFVTCAQAKEWRKR